MDLLSRLFRRPATKRPVAKRPVPSDGFASAPVLPLPVAVIGDVHGCDTLLGRLLDRIAAQHPDIDLVCVGDYIDRGERSAAVIDRLMARPEIVCLMGNHEAMCLNFLDDPDRHAERWLRYGGLQTLASYGVAGPRTASVTRPARSVNRVRDDLIASMGEARIAWLRGLPLMWSRGDLLVTHAGADPTSTPDAQATRDLLWGCSAFATQHRTDGIWVAHGHVVQDAGHATAGRIAVDTGAYATGVLTAAIVGDGPVRFVTT